MNKKTIRFAVIGCGLMGREFASAAARWCHLTKDIPAPVSINEAIELCKKYDEDKARRFVNGVLNAVKGEIADAE